MTSLTRRDLLRSGLAVSASTLVAGSVGRAHALLAAYPGAASAEALSAVAPREHLLFDFGWKFFQGHATDPLHDLGFGMGQGDFAKSGELLFATEKFDDSKWRALNLPHDWAVELPFVHDDEQQSHGYKPLGRRYPETSIGWYRRTFDIPKEDNGKRVTVEFDGAFRSALVFLNGYFIGRNDNGYAPFRFDVTDFLNYGGKNFLVVRMDASFGDGWFYEGAGIYRHVWLTKTDALHLGHWESYVRTAVKGTAATLNLGTLVQNNGQQSESCRVRWQIFDAAGKAVGTAEAAPQSVAADGSATFTTSTNVANPALWSPEAPNMYSVVVTVESGGKPRDAERLSFGVRTITWDADKGFFLNGKSVKIKGTCNHHDHAGVIMMVAGTLDLYRLAVEKESFVSVPRDCAYAKAQALRVARLAARLNRHHHRIHVRGLRRPECGIRHIGACRKRCGAIGSDGLWCRFCRTDRFPRRVEDLPAHAATLRLLAVVLHQCAEVQSRCGALYGSPDVALPMSQMQRIRLGQPHVPVNAGAFIEPTIAKARIHAHDQKILSAIVQKVGHVEAKWRVAVIVAPDEISVEKHQRAAKRAIKLNCDALSVVFFRNIEGAPVPADARLRISSSQGLVAVGLLFVIVHKRQFHCPVVRQIEGPPFRVVKFLRGKQEFARLGEISLPHAKAQIVQRVGGMSLKKLPAKIKEQMLARSHRRKSLRRRSAGVGCQQCMGTTHRSCDQGGGGDCKAGAKQIAAGNVPSHPALGQFHRRRTMVGRNTLEAG